MASFNAQRKASSSFDNSSMGNTTQRKKILLPRRTTIRIGVSLVFAFVCLIQQNSGVGESFFGRASRQLGFDWKTVQLRSRHLMTKPPNLGGHYVTLYVGNPAQPRRLLVSTTAHVTAFPCVGCAPKSCGTHKNYFDPSSSSSAQIANCFNCFEKQSVCVKDQCTIEVENTTHERIRLGDAYGAYDITDNAYLDVSADPLLERPDDIALTRGFPLRFHCQQHIEHDQYPQITADGLLSISTSPNSFIRQLKPDSSHIVSMCYHDFESVPQPEGTSAGSITIGGFDRTKFDSPLVYAKNHGKVWETQPYGFPYGVLVRKVFLGLRGATLEQVATGEATMLPIEFRHLKGEDDESSTMHLNRDGSSSTSAIPMDYSRLSGALDMVTIDVHSPTALHRSFEAGFIEAYRKVTGMEYGNDMPISEEKFSLLPTIFLQIESHLERESILTTASTISGLVGDRLSSDHPFDVLLAIPPHHYLEVDLQTRVAKPKLQFDRSHANLGAHALQGYEVVFDINKQRIGFAQRSQCEDGLNMLNYPSKGSKPEISVATAVGSVTTEATKENANEKPSVEITTDGTPETDESVKNKPVVLTSPTKDQMMTEQLVNQQEQQNEQVSSTSGTVINIANAAGAQFEESEEEEDDSRGPIATMLDTGNVAGAEYEESEENDIQGNQIESTSAGAQVSTGPELPQSNNDRNKEKKGLPEAEKDQEMPKMGRAGVQSRKTVPPPPTIMDKGGLWNLMGFAMFFLGFVVTAVATRDWESDAQERSYVGNIQHDDGGDAKSVFTYSGAKSVYGGDRSRGSSTQVRKKRWPWGKRAAGSDDQSFNSRGSFTKGGYDSKSFYTKSTRSMNTRSTADDEQSYYTRGNQSFYTKDAGDDQSYYTRGNQSFYTKGGGDDQTYYTRSSYDDEQTYYTRDEQTRDSQSFA